MYNNLFVKLVYIFFYIIVPYNIIHLSMYQLFFENKKKSIKIIGLIASGYEN